MHTKILLAGAFMLTLPGAVSLHAEEPMSTYSGYYGMGQGMIPGYGRGMGSGWCSWHLGQGMKAYGIGPGFRCGQGPMMGPCYDPFSGLNLYESQQKEMTEIRDELRKKHWELMGEMNDEYAKLDDLYNKAKLDPTAIDKQLERIYSLQRRMAVTSIEAYNQMESLLTPAQKQLLGGSYNPGLITR